ncbi:uncharacterized protein [Ptychodera flava]|uniref:uncharacterized protein n=1 Tax=Ptychodera flava TaxID=63121 RepID=UPI00396A0E0F
MGDEGLPSICRDIDDQCLQCPVCFGRYVRPKVLPSCGHIVCEDCLRGCLSGRSLKCPLCRKENFPNMQGNDVSTLPDSHVTKSLLDMVEKRERRQVGPANTTREKNTQMRGPRAGSNRRMAGYQTPDDTRSTRYNDTGGFAPVDVAEDRRQGVNSFSDQHTCPICGFSFPDLDTLEVHTMMCEPDPSLATTPSVSQAQINGGGRRAVPTTHRIASAANSSPYESTPSIDEYICPRCERPFPDLKTLQSHVDECIPDDKAFPQSPRRYNRHWSQRFSGRRDQRPRSAGRGPKPSRHYVPSAIHTNPSRANGGGRSSMERSVYSDRER